MLSFSLSLSRLHSVWYRTKDEQRKPLILIQSHIKRIEVQVPMICELPTNSIQELHCSSCRLLIRLYDYYLENMIFSLRNQIAGKKERKWRYIKLMIDENKKCIRKMLKYVPKQWKYSILYSCFPQNIEHKSLEIIWSFFLFLTFIQTTNTFLFVSVFLFR